MEKMPEMLKDKEELKESDEIYFKHVSLIERREAELYGELVELNALLRSIPVRRLNKAINKEKVRELIFDAGLAGMSRKSLRDEFNAVNKDCWTPCTECVTSCNTDCITSCQDCVTNCTSDCVTNCTTDCVTGCTSDCVNAGCSTACVTGCTEICVAGCTESSVVGISKGSKYEIPKTLDHGDKDISQEALAKMIVNAEQRGVSVKIDWI